MVEREEAEGQITFAHANILAVVVHAHLVEALAAALLRTFKASGQTLISMASLVSSGTQRPDPVIVPTKIT